MIVQLENILQDVRVCIDQNMKSDTLVLDGDIDTLSLNDIIKSKVVDAVRIVEKTAPVHLLENGHTFVYDGENDKSGVYWGKDFAGWVLLPDDFMRLIVFEMDDWERPVSEAITPESKDYQLQRSSIKGVRGNYQRPVCALCFRPEGRVLEFYSCKSDEATVSRAVYIPYPKIDDDGGVDLSEHCYPSIIYMCAGLTLATLGKDNESTNMINLSKSMMV